jgi:hypothetical protein
MGNFTGKIPLFLMPATELLNTAMEFLKPLHY